MQLAEQFASRTANFQIPPDGVEKSQPTDIVDIIL
jgi:hypothetical protein